jgi:transcriptional regulator with XRE-family HTH domain
MHGEQLVQYRKERERTQVEVAVGLGVSQTYLSLLEAGKRPLTDELKRKAARFFRLSATELPTGLDLPELQAVSDDRLASDLAALGYPGFAHLKRSPLKNPAVVLLSGLNSAKRDARLVEALPWVVARYWDMEWTALVKTAKAYDLQNRLGFVTNVARRVAELRGETLTAEKLEVHESEMEHSLLVREETLCNETMTKVERKWLAIRRPKEAKRWHLLTDLAPQNLNYDVW